MNTIFTTAVDRSVSRRQALRVVPLVLSLAALACGCASSGAKSAAVKPNESAEMAVVTGSLIPRQVTKDSQGFVSDMPVQVIDEDMLRRSGAATVAGALTKLGTNR